MDDTEGGEVGEVEALGNHLGADDDVDVAVSDFVVGVGEGFFGFSVGVKTGDAGGGEEFVNLGFEQFGAEAFMDDVGVFAFETRGGDGAF